MRNRKVTLFLGLAAVALYASESFGGDLNPPPGPIQPTNRVQLSQQAITLPYTINQSGSYVLTSSLTGISGENGIIIAADNVTIDLNGFSLIGVEGSGHGITGQSGAERNVTIRNGVVRNWGGSGVYNLGWGIAVSDVHASDNGGYGIGVGDNVIITRCTAHSNGGFAGIAVAYRGRITDCVSRDNSGHGFEAAAATILSGNVAAWNQGDGIRVENLCTVEQNSATQNQGAGIRVTVYASPANGNRIDSNNVVQNGTGIQVDHSGNTIIRNSAQGNTTNFSVVADNIFGPVLDPTSVLTNPNPFANFGM